MDDSEPPRKGRQASTDLVPTGSSRGDGGATGKRALRVLKQRMPGLPDTGTVVETALVIGALGVAGTLAWPYLMAVLAIPIFLVKVGLTGVGIYALFWIGSKLSGGRRGKGSDDEDLAATDDDDG